MSNFSVKSTIGPLQLTTHVVQTRHAGEQRQNQKKGIRQMVISFVHDLSCPSATFALQHGGLVPRKWLAVKGLSGQFIGTGLVRGSY